MKLPQLFPVNAVQVLHIVGIQQFIEEEFRDMPASFGGDIPSEGLQGLLVVGDPADGCKPLNKPPVAENFTGKWIVLLARYNCSFEVKVRNAQLAGYKCAIVHNVNSSSLETMSAKNAQDIVIPSVFVSDLAGEILEQAYSYTSGYFVMVNGDLPFDINTHLLLPFAIVVVLCLLVILVFMIVKCIKDRRRARRHRLPNRCLKKIPTCKFSKGDPYDTCAICLDDYQEGERLRVLPCAHAYHAKCIDPWLTQNRRVCPVCKRRVLAAGERRRRHSDTESDDTEPLVTSGQGQSHGTFEEQSENPFSRAARYVSRLRDNLRRPNDAETPAAAEGDASNEPDEAPPSDVEAPADTAPLLARARRERRERRERARTRARARSASASINGDQGEIGVAALPVTPQPVAPPPHVDL